jgi:integrase
MDCVGVKWPSASARHRKGISEALTDVTTALLPRDSSAPSEDRVRSILYSWAFNVTARTEPVPEDLEPALRWLRARSPLLSDLERTATLRRVLDRLSLRQDGTAAAASTIARKRATLHNALEYAVELELMATNPLHKVRWKAPRVSDVVDNRVVVNPDQARRLLMAVWELDPALAGFFACLYYAALRPSEARDLRLSACSLPDEGWGRLLLTGSTQASGTRWTDAGALNETRGLKHRARQDTRSVPAHPELVAWLRRHLDTFGCGADGRLFVTRTGRAGVPIAAPYLNPVSMGTVYRAWARARDTALTAGQRSSLLARRPYDLRHACVSTWLSAGVAPPQVAVWAGHSVEVLLRVYAKCIDDSEAAALQRIEAALRSP